MSGSLRIPERALQPADVLVIGDTIIFGRVLAGSSVGGTWANAGWTGAIALRQG